MFLVQSGKVELQAMDILQWRDAITDTWVDIHVIHDSASAITAMDCVKESPNYRIVRHASPDTIEIAERFGIFDWTNETVSHLFVPRFSAN